MGKRGKKVSLKKGFFYTFTFILLTTIFVFTCLWYINEKQNLNLHSKKLTEMSEAQQKEYLVEEVNKAISIINSIAHNPGIDSSAQKETAISVLADIRLRHGGYLFINKVDGQALLFDGEKVVGYKNLSDMVDPTGLRLFDIEKEAYHSDDGKFMEYLFKRIDTSEPEPKISFMKGYPQWQWIIGAGTYKKAPTKELMMLKKDFRKSFLGNFAIMLAITVLLTLASIVLVNSINNKLHSNVNIITQFLHEAAANDQMVDTQKLSFKEFYSIGQSLNNMIDEKRQLTKKFIEKDQDIKSIFSAATNVGFIVSTMDGEESVIKEFSPGAEFLFGFKEKEIVGEKLSTIHLPNAEKSFSKFQHILSRKKDGYQAETILLKKDKTTFDALFSTHQLQRDDKKDTMICVIIDISKRKKAENDLRQLKESLENSINERTQELINKNIELIEKNQKLESFNDLFVGREFRIKELKNKITELKNKIKH